MDTTNDDADCITSNKLVNAKSNAVSCDKCYGWSHIRCGTGITYYMYKKALKGKAVIDWICIQCKSEEESNTEEENEHITQTAEENLNSTTVNDNIPNINNVNSSPNVSQIRDNSVRVTAPGSPNLDDLVADNNDISVASVDSFSENNLVDSLLLPEQCDLGDPSQIVTYTLVEKGSSRSKNVLVDSLGYTYNKDYDGQTNTWWRCVVRNKNVTCSAAVKFHKANKTYSRTDIEHKCQAKVTALQNAQLGSQVRKEAKSKPFASASTIVTSANTAIQQHLPLEAPIVTLPKPSSYSRMANRVRQANRSTNPSQLEFDLQDEHIPDGFLQGDVSVGARRHIIFYTLYMATLLMNVKTWFVDATFKAIGLPFKQLWVVHGFLKQDSAIKQVPLAFVFMSGKRKEDYIAVLRKLKENLNTISCQKAVMDFEAAESEAFRAVFPNVILQGCVFHWTQAVWRKVQQCGLSEAYRKHSNTYKFIRHLLCLAFLPSTHIVSHFNSMKELCGHTSTSPLTKLLDYIQNTWIDNPMFPVSARSVFDQHVRSNNDTEGWNRRLNSKISRPGMNFYLLVNLLWEEGGLIPTQAQLVSEELLQRHQKLSSHKRENSIQTLFEKFKKSEMTTKEFMTAMSLIHGPKEK